jgi:O-antigen/teichoic acid export membrane protein
MISNKRASIYRLLGDYMFLGINFVQGFVLIPLYLHNIDSREYGAWLATGNILAYLGLLDFGINAALMQKISFRLGKSELSKLGSLISVGILISLFLSSICLTIIFILAPYIPAFVNIHSGSRDILVQSFKIAGCGTCTMIITYSISSILIGLKRTLFNAIVGILSSVVGIIVTLLLLFRHLGISAIAYGFLAQSLFYFVASFLFLCVIVLSEHRKTFSFFSVDQFKDLIGAASLTFVSKIARVGSTQSDSMILASIKDPLLSTVYTVTGKATNILQNFVARISSSVMPTIANYKGSGEHDKLIMAYQLTLKLIFLSGIVIFGGVFLFNDIFVHYWVGDKFYGGNVLSLFIVLYIFSYTMYGAIWDTIFGLGLIKTTSLLSIVEVVSRILLSVVFTYYWSFLGLAIACLVSLIFPVLVIVMNRSSEIANIKIALKETLPSYKMIGIILVFYLAKIIAAPTELLGWIMFVSGYVLISMAYLYRYEREFVGVIRLAISRKPR